MPVYEARPASGPPAPIVVCVSEVWGVHEWVRDVTRRFAKAGYYAVAPELFKREGGVGQIPDIQDILKIVLAVPRKQLLGDVAATIDWAKKRSGARADRVGVTGWCWGGGVVYQVAATNPDIKAAVAWYGPPGRSFPDQPAPVSGFDVAKDIKVPLLGLYGETDTSPTPADARKLGDLVKQHNPNVEIVIYPGAGHAFFADYRPSLQRRRGRGRLEALHRLVRQVPQGLNGTQPRGAACHSSTSASMKAGARSGRTRSPSA